MNALTQGFRCLGTAHRALMAAATSVHAYEGAAGLHNLVIKAAHEVGPPLVENLAVHSAFWRTWVPGVLHGAASRADEIANV